MTDDRNFDRIARAWLELGPNEAPDRAVSAVLNAVETTRQVRRPTRPTFWGASPAARLRVITAALAGLVIVIVGIQLSRSDNQVAAPLAIPSPGPTWEPAGAIPDALRMRRADGTFPDLAVWVSGPRSLSGPGAASGTGLRFTDSTLALARSYQIDQPLLVTSASGTADGSLRLAASTKCPSGIVDDYVWWISGDGRRLMIRPESVDCAVPSAALLGDWNKVDCKDPVQPCLGDLAAETYSSLNLDPRLKAIDGSAPEYGALTYTVPDGWANAADWPGELVLVPSTDYAGYGPNGSIDGSLAEVVVAADAAMSDQTTDCTGSPLTSVAHSVEGFISWLRAQPRIVASKPTAITVGGHPGQWIDVKVAPTWKGTCPDVAGGTPTAVILTPAYGTTNLGGGTGTAASWPIGGDEQMRLVFVDIGQGDVALIWVDATDPARFGSLAAEAMPIIESMTFK
jgi:hypothetical protein